jgi:SSS family solute:Na+ symporter
MAAIVSLVGYIGFTSSQLLAGAKLASATFPDVSLTTIIIIMGAIAVVYTSMGGIKAVIYTDTVQWIILLLGLVCIGIPLGYLHLGGWEKISSILPASYFKLNQVGAVELFNWALTIIPIWFVGMTLYQRIYSAGSQKTAIRAWRIAGWFEWPVMAFMGVVLGVFAKAAYLSGEFSAMGYLPTDPMDAELGLPLFLKHILPVGLLGLMMSAYFSAILSTADSCLMAASGNMHTDILRPLSIKLPGKNLRQSQLISLVLGVLAVFIAIKMTSVLELMLYSYAFMVSGLLVPVLAMLVLKKPSPLAAVYAIISGGLSTLVLIGFEVNLPYGLDANFFGIAISLFTFTSIHFIQKKFNGIYNP